MKKIITLVLCITSMLFFNNTVNAVQTGYVNCDILNVRVSPNTNCEIVTKLSNGNSFDIVYTIDNWHNIRMQNGVTGFVSAKFVSMDNNLTNQNFSQIANMASKYLGYSYSYGASGPYSFDCSGFTSYIYKQYGYSLPRTASSQGTCGTYIDKSQLQEGDLVFFSNRGDRKINHVGIYVGNSQFIHAATSARGVVKDSLNSSYFTKNYISARRVL